MSRKRGKKRTCRNCNGWGYIRLGMPIFGPSFPCCDCHGRGYFRDEPEATP